MGKKFTINFSDGGAVLTDIREVNSSFAVGKLKVMYTGFNRNGTHISKEAVQEAIKTIFNVPIVAHYDRDFNSIGGHDESVERDSNGVFKTVPLTVPCGVVSDHTQVYFEVSEDPNGREREYLVADGVILWKRQDVYRHLVVDKGGITGHSMEIEVEDGSFDVSTGYLDIRSFEFQALCLLGDHVEPCFEGSELVVYSADKFKDQMQEMMSELRRDYAEISAYQTRRASQKEKGDETMDEKIQLLKEYGITAESLDFELESISLEELRRRVQKLVDEQKKQEPDADPDEAESDDKQDDSEGQNEGGSDSEEPDTEDSDNADGDDNADGNTEGSEAEPEANQDAVPDAAQNTEPEAGTDAVGAESFEAKYNEAMTLIESLKAELSDLRRFKAESEKAAEDDAKRSIFGRFADISETDAFADLKAKADSLTAEELEEKCYAIRGRMYHANGADGAPAKFSVNRTEENTDAPYGGIVEQYVNHKGGI